MTKETKNPNKIKDEIFELLFVKNDLSFDQARDIISELDHKFKKSDVCLKFCPNFKDRPYDARHSLCPYCGKHE